MHRLIQYVHKTDGKSYTNISIEMHTQTCIIIERCNAMEISGVVFAFQCVKRLSTSWPEETERFSGLGLTLPNATS